MPDSLTEIWAEKFAEAMYHHKGIISEDNTSLMRTIEGIRNGYFRFFDENLALVTEFNQDLSNHELKKRIGDVNYDMIDYGHESFLHLQQAGCDLNPSDAENLMKAIVSACCKSYNHSHTIKVARVPKMPLNQTAEELGVWRSKISAESKGAQGKLSL